MSSRRLSRRRPGSLGGKTGNTGIAAMEFGLLVPVLVVIFLGIVDFSVAYHDQLQLSSALASAADYAFTQGQTESGATLTTDVTNFVRTVSPIPLSAVSATYNNGGSATSCYCVSGSPSTYTQTTCGAACTDGSGSTAGKYISISASFSFTPLFPLQTVVFGNSYSQSVTVRLQ